MTDLNFRVNVVVHGCATGALAASAATLGSWFIGIIAAAMAVDGLRSLWVDRP